MACLQLFLALQSHNSLFLVLRDIRHILKNTVKGFLALFRLKRVSSTTKSSLDGR